jgi:hypothetical protein
MEAMVKYSGRLLIFAILLVLLSFVQSVHAGDKTEVVNDFENFISDGNFFTALIPKDWEKEEDIILGRTAKEYGVILIGPRGMEGTPVMITVLYYGDGKDTHDWIKSAEDFINLNSKPNRRPLLEGEEYGKVGEITLAGRKAKKFDRKTFVSISTGSKKILIFERFVVVPTVTGFYKIQYEAPSDLAKKYESVFDKVINSFKPNVK